MASNPRTRNGNARRKIRQRLKSRDTHCAICGGELDWSIKDVCDPKHVEIDEIIPVSLFAESEQLRACIDINNVQAVHRLCNQKKGNKLNYQVKRLKPTKQGKIQPSQRW